MEDLNSTISSQDMSYDYSNFTSLNISCNNSNITSECKNENFPWKVALWTIIFLSLPLILVAIYALYSKVRNDHVAPIYVINLLISDLIQLCCMIRLLIEYNVIFSTVHIFSLMASVGFMVCIALERYLIIACPLWYRFRRNIKTSVVICVVVWVFCLVFTLTYHFLKDYKAILYIFGVFFLLPFPLFIFFLAGTLKALSASCVRSDEKRRIVGILVLVLLTYTLLFLPIVILFLGQGDLLTNKPFRLLTNAFMVLNPLADLVLYVFMGKGIIDKLLASVCRSRRDRNDSTATHSSIL